MVEVEQRRGTVEHGSQVGEPTQLGLVEPAVADDCDPEVRR